MNRPDHPYNEAARLADGGTRRSQPIIATADGSHRCECGFICAPGRDECGNPEPLDTGRYCPLGSGDTPETAEDYGSPDDALATARAWMQEAAEAAYRADFGRARECAEAAAFCTNLMIDRAAFFSADGFPHGLEIDPAEAEREANPSYRMTALPGPLSDGYCRAIGRKAAQELAAELAAAIPFAESFCAPPAMIDAMNDDLATLRTYYRKSAR